MLLSGYGLNICVSPNFMCEVLASEDDGITGFGKQSGFKGIFLMNGIRVFIKAAPEGSLTPSAM